MIINKDCLECLDILPDNIIIVTDPPFNIGYHYNNYKDNLIAEARINNYGN